MNDVSRIYHFSIIDYQCYFFSISQLCAQEQEGEIIIISERVGKEIDQQERDKFKLFQGVKGFQSAVYLKLPDGRYFLKITYLDEETGELKIKRIEQSEILIKISRDYINHFQVNIGLQLCHGLALALVLVYEPIIL